MTTAPTPPRANALACEYRPSMPADVLHLWAKDAVAELIRLQSENERISPDRAIRMQQNDRMAERIAELEAQLVAEAHATAEHKLRADQLAQQHRMQAQMHAQATQQLAELEARKPLPLSDEQLRAEFIPWAEIHYRHEDEFTVRDFKICLAAWSAGHRAALVDKSPNLQEPLVEKTANLHDRPAPLSDDDRLRLRSDVARAIWDVMREHEDRCGHALEDVEPKHQVWDCADAAIRAMKDKP